MKHLTFILTFVIFASLTACGQTKNKATESKKAIENIKFVFDDYIKYQESTDSQDDKDLMTKSLESLNKVTDQKELEILINVWMYYDPTDFPSRNLVSKILKESRPESIKAVKLHISNKKEWETDETAPYSELKNLLKQLDNNSNNTLELLQGLWYHDQDSLAYLTINENIWTFNYKGEQPEYNDIYTISFTDKLPNYVIETVKAEFLILTNETDTLEYEILGITDTTFSLMYFPAGKIHLYKRQK